MSQLEARCTLHPNHPIKARNVPSLVLKGLERHIQSFVPDTKTTPFMDTPTGEHLCREFLWGVEGFDLSGRLF